MKRKKFTIPKFIKKFGHPKSDYKQDGTLKKNKQEPREYWEWENVSVEGKELIVDGKHIGYIIPDDEYSWRDCHGNIGTSLGMVRNENGSIIKSAFCTDGGEKIHYDGLNVFQGRGNDVVMNIPSHATWYFTPLWICDENNEPLYILKKHYDKAKRMYALNKIDEWIWERYFNPSLENKSLKDYENEFDSKYKNKTIIMNCGNYSDYYYNKMI